MYQDGSVKGSPEGLVAKLYSTFDILRNAGGIQCGLGEEAAESFGCEADIVFLLGTYIGDQCPGKLIGCRAAYLLGIGMLCDEGALAIFCTGIVGLTRWYFR